jgi:N-methylhydantoinase B
MYLAHGGQRLKAKGRQAVPAGERLVMAMPGGGGYGAAFERDPGRVREDVIDGLVSRDAALRDYGVALTDTLEVDVAATTRARAAD